MNDSVNFRHIASAVAVTQDLEINRMARDIADAALVLKRCENELRGWMLLYGTDLDSQNLVSDVIAILKRLKQ